MSDILAAAIRQHQRERGILTPERRAELRKINGPTPNGIRFPNERDITAEEVLTLLDESDRARPMPLDVCVEIARLCQLATPGQWEVFASLPGEERHYWPGIVARENGRDVADIAVFGTHDDDEAGIQGQSQEEAHINARLIVILRNHALWLIGAQAGAGKAFPKEFTCDEDRDAD